MGDIDTVWLRDPVQLVKLGNRKYKMKRSTRKDGRTKWEESERMKGEEGREGLRGQKVAKVSRKSSEGMEEKKYEKDEKDEKVMASTEYSEKDVEEEEDKENKKDDKEEEKEKEKEIYEEGEGEEEGEEGEEGEGEFESVDISVTDDNGEICGCFVALNNTPNALAFWATVTAEHRWEEEKLTKAFDNFFSFSILSFSSDTLNFCFHSYFYM